MVVYINFYLLIIVTYCKDQHILLSVDEVLQYFQKRSKYAILKKFIDLSNLKSHQDLIKIFFQKITYK